MTSQRAAANGERRSMRETVIRTERNPLDGVDTRSISPNSPLFHQMKRLQIIKEIVATESVYVADLEALVTYYQIPLRKRGLVPTEDLVEIFSNIELILSIHCELLKKLRERLGIESIVTERSKIGGGTAAGAGIQINTNQYRSISFHVGDIFMEMANSFLAYDQFCTNFKKSTDAIKRCYKNTAFTQFLEEQRAECNNLTLRDYMIKPIQRICRYPLLFRELLKHTPHSHNDYTTISTCKQRLEEITTHINMSKFDAENIHVLLKIEASLSGYKSLAVPGRIYLHDGPLVKISPDGRRAQERHFFLFNDFLIYAKSKGGGFARREKSYQYKGKIPLGVAMIRSLDDDSGRRNGFQLIRADTKRIYLFYARSQAEKELWMQKLQVATDNKRQKDVTSLKDKIGSKTAAPVPPTHPVVPKRKKKKNRGSHLKTEKGDSAGEKNDGGAFAARRVHLLLKKQRKMEKELSSVKALYKESQRRNADMDFRLRVLERALLNKGAISAQGLLLASNEETKALGTTGAVASPPQQKRAAVVKEPAPTPLPKAAVVVEENPATVSSPTPKRAEKADSDTDDEEKNGGSDSEGEEEENAEDLLKRFYNKTASVTQQQFAKQISDSDEEVNLFKFLTIRSSADKHGRGRNSQDRPSSPGRSSWAWKVPTRHTSVSAEDSSVPAAGGSSNFSLGGQRDENREQEDDNDDNVGSPQSTVEKSMLLFFGYS